MGVSSDKIRCSFISTSLFGQFKDEALPPHMWHRYFELDNSAYGNQSTVDWFGYREISRSSVRRQSYRDHPPLSDVGSQLTLADAPFPKNLVYLHLD